MGEYFVIYKNRNGQVWGGTPIQYSGLKDMYLRDLFKRRSIIDIEVVYDPDIINERPIMTEQWKRKKFCGFYLNSWKNLIE